MEFRIGDKELPYTSFSHVSGHIASAYASSPFAAREEPSYVLVWDGTMFPRLYLVGPGIGAVNHGVLFPMIGHSYAAAAEHFGPFRCAGEIAFDNLGLAGKLMAYIALGRPHSVLLDAIRRAFHDHFEGDSVRAVQYRAYVGATAPYIQAAMPR
jgi:carbamoyltransferase